MVFIVFEKAYDEVSRELFWRYLEAGCVSIVFIMAIKDMCDRDKMGAIMIG